MPLQRVLHAMAKTEIRLSNAAGSKGLVLAVPGLNCWNPNDAYAQDFTQLPEAFAQSYLKMRLRNFLYETFCSTAHLQDGESQDQAVNDRLGGGLQVGLLQQFDSSNQGTGYFDPGWRVIGQEADGTLAVEKYGVTIHINPMRHLLPGHRAPAVCDRQLPSPNERVAVLLPSYRYEPGCYVAISNLGPVDAALEQAIEIYFAATAAAMPPIMRAITTALSAVVPYTLRVPYQAEGYGYAESVALRVRCADNQQVLPVVQQIAQDCGPLLCSLQPVFARSLYSDISPGISVADVIAESPVTHWFGSSADLSRVQLVADALAAVWYEAVCDKPAADQSVAAPLNAQNLIAMEAQFTQANVSWQSSNELQ